MSTLIIIPSLPGLASSLTRSLSLNFDNSFYTVFKTKIKWGMLSFFIGFCISVYYFYNGNTTLATGFLVVSIFAPLIDSFTVNSSFLQAKKYFKQLSFFNSAKSILLSLFIFIEIIFYINFFLNYYINMDYKKIFT